MMKSETFMLLLLLGGSASAFSSGAPSDACISLTPDHGGSRQSPPSPYTVDLSVFNMYGDGENYYLPGQIYQLNLSSHGSMFRGFLLQARLIADDTTLTGSFTAPVSGTKLSACSPSSAGLTHTGNSTKLSVTGKWTAPSPGTGPIRFRFAVVQSSSIYWADVMSGVVYESGTGLVFKGALLPNNSLVMGNEVGNGSDGLTCTSENADCCNGSDAAATDSGWFSPDGSPLHEGRDGATDLYITRGPRYVHLNRITGGTPSLYWCVVPDRHGTLQRFYIGLYSSNPGSFHSVQVEFELQTEVTEDPPLFTLTCISEGSPVTSVVWEREGEEIVDDASHSSSQIVVNAVDVVYHNVLMVRGRNGGEYTCTVYNSMGTFSGRTIDVRVATGATNLRVVQTDNSGTSIIITWSLPSLPTPTASGFAVLYETSDTRNCVSVDLCTECELIVSGLIRGSNYSVWVITESAQLPSDLIGPVNITSIGATFFMSPTSVTGEIGSDVRLQCGADGHPAPTIQWFHFRSVVTGTGNSDISEEMINSTAVVSSLAIRGLHTVQYGQYYCRANGQVDSEPATLSFTGEITVDNCEEVYDLSSNVTVSIARTTCFRCPGQGPVLKWLVNGQPVNSSTGVTSDDGVLAVFLANQAFNIESPTMLACMTQSLTSAFYIKLEGPPADFGLVAKTHTSLSFSWGLPLVRGTLAGYLLKCRATVMGVSDPPVVNTMEQSASLFSLSPGVLYFCTVTAVTVSNIMSPPATITASTLESAPTGPPLGLTAEAIGARNISFTWQPPEPHLQNGKIIFHTIACSPTPFSPFPLVTETRTVMFGGFSPFTTYSCSVRATSGAGTGPPAHVNITTADDSTLFQVKVLGLSNCPPWIEDNKEEKVADMTSALVHNINARCNCSFTSNGLLDGEFYCFDTDSKSVTYRGRLRGLARVNSSNLTAYVAAWVATGGTILLHNIIFHLDSRCTGEVVIKDLLSPECAPTNVEGSVPGGSLSGREIGAATVVSLVSAVIGLVAAALGVIFKDKVRGCLCNLRKNMMQSNKDLRTSEPNTDKTKKDVAMKETEFQPCDPNKLLQEQET